MSGVTWHEAPPLWLVTRGAQPISGEQRTLAAAQAALWGFGRTVAVEHAELWGGLVDLDPDSTPDQTAALLVSHLVSPDQEDQIAFRGGERYAARLVRVPRADTASAMPSVAADGTYLITGGLGGIGLQVARWLAERGARHLVLLGRTPLPDRSAWDAIDGDDTLTRRIAAIRAIEALGTQVRVAEVDVGDRDQLSGLLADLRARRWPAIRGVMHAAGVVAHHALLDHSLADMHAMMRAKTLGSWHLHRLLHDAPLDFFVLFSSASAVLSSPRLASYAAANAFMDGLAHHRQLAGQPALSVNWGLWSDIGMATRFDADELGAIVERGMGALSPARGLEALSRLLGIGVAQAAVLPVNWERWARLYPTFVTAPILRHLVGSALDAGRSQPVLTRRTLLTADADARRRLAESYLADQASHVLRMDRAELDPAQPLSELGLDSLMATELRHRIESDLQLVIPMVRILEGPSVAALAMRLLHQLDESAGASDPSTTPTTPSDDSGHQEGYLSLSDRDRTADVLANLDHLSGEQLDALLATLMDDEGHAA
jgi:NAD(P)-dependent dehydrogenase (short-subunit alcohol dehydrogenase family)/acyl carrier protein